MKKPKLHISHAFMFALLSTAFVFFLHHLPVNQLFIDPFSEAIKNHDIMDIAFSEFRSKKDPALYDHDVIIINNEITDREKMSQTIDYLLDEGVAAVGIDLVFDTFYQNRADTLLRNSLMSEKVVLAYSFLEHGGHTHDGQKSEDKHAHSSIDLKSHDFFKDVAQEAFINLSSNDGFTVRAFEPYHVVNDADRMAFSVKLADMKNEGIADIMKERGHEKEWINFRRVQPGKTSMQFPINSDQMIHYEFYGMSDFLRDTSTFKEGYFKDRIALIGFSGENENTFSMKDRYYTPINEKYHGRSLPDMHGVTVHANIISMLLDKDFINDVPEYILYLIAFLIYVINYILFIKLMKKNLFVVLPISRLIQLLQFILLLSACVLLLHYYSIKCGFIIIITSVILSFELFEFYDHKLGKIIAPYIGIEAPKGHKKHH